MESYEKLNYTIRPSKQIERKLFIEALHYLGQHANYPVRNYTYMGFGSVFYADFIMFHKYLYINDMICIEGSDIPKRMDLNKPYEFIQLEMGRVSDVLPRINFKNTQFIVWLDYDYGLCAEVLDDLDNFSRALCPGSIINATVEAEPKLRDREENEKLSRQDREKKLIDLYNDHFDTLLEEPVKKRDLAWKSLPRLFAKVLKSQFETSMTKRPDDVLFWQLFNFRYADGAQMLTVGGIIDVPEKEKQLQGSGIYDLNFIEAGEEPKLISVPPLTFREKESIDRQIDKGISLDKIDLKFELRETLLKNYLDFYRHYPTFHEAII